MDGRKEIFSLTMHSTHFIYGYVASDIWLRTILIVRKETRCRHMGYYFRLAARVLLYAPSHRQDDTYHGLCCTSHGGLTGTRNSNVTHLIRQLHPVNTTVTCIWIQFGIVINDVDPDPRVLVTQDTGLVFRQSLS